MADVALVENGNGGAAVDPEQDQPTITNQQQPRNGQRDVFDPGGPGGVPVVRIPTSGGSIELGHEDILLMVLLLDLGIRAAQFWMEVR